MKTFQETKEFIVTRATELDACEGQLDRANEAETIEDLLSVIKDNLGWVSNHKLFTWESIQEYFTKEQLLEYNIGNTGAGNAGFSNSGDSNSGYRNSGDSNSGYRNSGSWNSGDRNSGYRNSGDSNSGYRNSGDSNSGYRNSGSWNSGDRNSGYRNSGDSNSGSWNSGDRNSGYRNSGSWNSGDRNSGDSNSGYRNSGAFCTNQNPKVFLFDVECSLTVKEWEEHPACRIMQNNLETHLWVPSGSMTDEQKAAWPKHETTGGFLKAISMHDAWKDMWHNLTEDKKALFTSLPHFDPAKFLEITGINVNP